jgi:hypothetical protein
VREPREGWWMAREGELRSKKAEVLGGCCPTEEVVN